MSFSLFSSHLMTKSTLALMEFTLKVQTLNIPITKLPYVFIGLFKSIWQGEGIFDF
jgi:hypothetical protein